MHRLVTNEKRPGSLRWAVARRMHWWWGGHGDDECRHSASCELYALGGTYNHGWGFEIRLDGPYAETPIDAMVSAGRLVSIFASTSLGRGLCRALGVRDEHPRGVEFRISLGEGVFRWTNATVLWSLWTDPDHQVLTQWQRKNAGLSRWYQARCGYIYPIKWVLDRLWGKTTYTAEALETAEVTAHLEDGPYPLALTLERATWNRPRWPRPALRRTPVGYQVKSTAEGVRGYAESSYKYGGDGLVSAATRALTSFEAADPESWIPIAIASFTERVLKDRARNHWKPPTQPAAEITA